MIKVNGKETLSQKSFHCRNIKGSRLTDELYRDKRQLCRDREWQEYNTSQLRQVFLCCDKVFSMEPTQGRIYVATKKSCRDITLRIHNKEQQNICRDKDYFCRDKQNMREVNSLLRQEIEEQHKRNGDKEIHVAT